MSSWYEKGNHKKMSKSKSYRKSYFDTIETETVLSVIENTTIVAVPQQNISLKAAQYFGIRSSVSQQDGVTPTATYFPYYDQYGKLDGFMKRDWSKDKATKGHFTTIGNVSISCQMWGQHVLEHNNRKAIYITEGQGDVVAVWQAFYDELEKVVNAKNRNLPKLYNYAKSVIDSANRVIDCNKKGEKIPSNLNLIPIVGLPLGCGNASEAVAHNEKFFSKCDKVVIGLDNDEATKHEKDRGVMKGVEATNAIASFLVNKEVFVVTYPCNVNEGYKDMRHLYERGMSDIIYKMFTKTFKRFVPEKIVQMGNTPINELFEEVSRGVEIPFFEKFNAMTGGCRLGELWINTGPSGVGKTLVARYIEYSILQHLRLQKKQLESEDDSADKKQDRMCIIHLEETKQQTEKGMYAIEMGYSPNDFIKDIGKFTTKEEVKKVADKIAEEELVFIYDHFGSISTSELIEKLRTIVFMYGCKWIVLDHISMVISGRNTNDERKDLDILCTELATFCVQYNVFILANCHIKRIDNIPTPRDKQTQLPLPYWYPLKKEHLRGSAALEQLSFTIFGVTNEVLPTEERGRVKILVMKNRNYSEIGTADIFVVRDGKIVDASDWEWKDGRYFDKNQPILNYKPDPVTIEDDSPALSIDDSSIEEEPPF